MIIIDPEFQSLIPALQPDEYNLLEKNIKEEGCRDPLLIWGEILIDGHNRYEICNANNIKFETKELKFENRNEVKIWIIKNQFGRRNLSNYARIILALQLEEFFREKAIKNLSLGGQGLTTLSKVNTREELAKTASVAEGTIAKVKVIEKSATPEIKERLRNQEISINQAYNDIKKEIKKEERMESIKQDSKIPDGKFDVIYADPPWQYSNSGLNGSAEKHYPTMPTQEISLMPIQKSCKENCVLFLWATNPLLEDAFIVLNGWGFNYKTNFVWIKDKSTFGKLNFYVSGKHELLLIATKGQMVPYGEMFSSIIDEKKSIHSKKPDIVYEMIEKMYPNAKYLELFAREKRQGWESFGNQI